MSTMPEYWLRGPVNEVPPLLQPVAHALLQAREEVILYMKDFPSTSLWATPAGMASVAFHLQHLTGVLDRLFTYAKGLPLTDAQLSYLSVEGKETDETDLDTMLRNFVQTIDNSVSGLSGFDEKQITAIRYVGRKKLPSTVIGLLFHAAEHTMRHTGQLLVTVSWLKSI